MKLRVCALVLAAAVAAGGPVQVLARDTPAGPTASERLVTARKAIDAKDWSKAVFELTQAAQDDPNIKILRERGVFLHLTVILRES